MPAVPLSDLQYFLLDMDGTVYLGPRAIPGAQEFIAYLRASGRRYLFFTNNPAGDAARYSEKLQQLGIEATPADILTSGEATTRYLVSETPYRRLYVLGTPSFEQELVRAGLELTNSRPDAVVLAFDTTLTYTKLEQACLLLREGLPYIATNPDKVCPTDYGYIPDCGSIAALLEAATGRAPKYIGKPNVEMVRMGLEKLGADPARTAMVGDRLYTDMEMALRAGITAICVLSGETRAEQLAAAPQHPHYVFESVGQLKQALEASG
ncbi:MAG: HAD-IIA family hydrolase [Candidatus Hydrogenedentes bacterium]|nr:HAD-IIA family hydrolase [Candidatus Hydrogenedentota bacterium]MBI3119553.1 HAD-IIA family hydrolase [Candidatus Hydrogenedentota bacterium]